MDNFKAGFGVVDYCVFAATLAISLGIGLSSAFKKKDSTPEEFLLGGRTLQTIPVALSLLITYVSAINIIGYAGEIYAYGTQICMGVAGGILGSVCAVILTVPIFYPLRLTSINEYIEMRFKSKGLRLCVMLLGFINIQIAMGVVMYAPSIALASVTPLNYVTNIVAIGVVCTIYSTLGGIRAVVWTDVFQFFVIILGLCIIVVVGTMEVGGISKVYSLARDGGRLQLFNMNPSIYERHTFFNTITFGFFFIAAVCGTSQANLQRICAVPTMKEAKKVVMWNILATLSLHVIMFGAGVVAYAAYAGCDPISEGKIQRKEEILSYYIVDKLGYVTGLSGIFVASLTASTLSTFSSTVNSLAAILWKDILSKIKYCSSASPKTATLINRLLSGLLGTMFIGMAFITSRAGSMIQFVLSIGGLVAGSIFGVFLLGMCVPRCTAKGAWSGFIVSCVFMSWIYFGAVFYGSPPTPLSFSTEFCINNISESSSNLSSSSNVNLFTTPESADHLTKEMSANNFPLMYLYGISYTMYPMLAPLICLLVGIIVSYATGPLKLEEVELHLISPFLRKFYAKRSQICRITDNGVTLTAVKDTDMEKLRAK